METQLDYFELDLQKLISRLAANPVTQKVIKPSMLVDDEDKVDEERETETPRERSSQTYSMAEVSNHCGADSCWIVLWDNVYDITNFLREHPAGEDIILENAGRDATVPFKDVGHSKDALLMLEKFCIGMLVENERIFKRKKANAC